MKFRISLLLGLGLLLAGLLPAQENAPPEQLDQLLGPIALYPDALIALILPAATQPSDVAQAAQYLHSGGDPDRTDGQPWDDSLKALAHYPDIVNWMDQNMAWTEELGEAFDEQPADVMNSIQHLRAEARAAGTLVDTPQQQVIMADGELSIIPAQPDVIYVPYYDPAVVYESRPGFYADSYLTFGVGYGTGFWLSYDVDWRQRRIWTIDPRDRQRYWRDHHDWRQPVMAGRQDYGNDPNRHQWQPRPSAARPPRPAITINRPRAAIARPAPFPNAPSRPASPRPNPADRLPDNRNQPSEPNHRPENPPAQPPGRNVAPVQPPLRPPAPLPSPQQVRPAPPGQDGRDNRDNRDDGRRREPDGKPAVVPPQPARVIVPPPAPPAREARPIPPAARQPTQSPAKDDRDNRDNNEDRSRRGSGDKSAVVPPPQPVRPPPPPPAPPKQVRPVPPPRNDDNGKDDKDDKDDRRRDQPDDRQKN